jgi:hypothetical protein
MNMFKSLVMHTYPHYVEVAEDDDLQNINWSSRQEPTVPQLIVIHIGLTHQA